MFNNSTLSFLAAVSVLVGVFCDSPLDSGLSGGRTMPCLISVEPDTCLIVGAKCTLMDIKKVFKEAG